MNGISVDKEVVDLLNKKLGEDLIKDVIIDIRFNKNLLIELILRADILKGLSIDRISEFNLKELLDIAIENDILSGDTSISFYHSVSDTYGD